MQCSRAAHGPPEMSASVPAIGSGTVPTSPCACAASSSFPRLVAALLAGAGARGACRHEGDAAAAERGRPRDAPGDHRRHGPLPGRTAQVVRRGHADRACAAARPGATARYAYAGRFFVVDDTRGGQRGLRRPAHRSALRRASQRQGAEGLSRRRLVLSRPLGNEDDLQRLACGVARGRPRAPARAACAP